MGLRVSWAVSVMGIVLLLAPDASAVDGNSPRTPVTFLNQDCVTVVDRSVDSTIQFDLGLPNEDLDVTGDELPDSRTIQLVAFCRDDAPSDPAPAWITRDDAERALAQGVIDTMPDAADILDESPDWSDCAFAINEPDARVPITCDDVADGLTWDTSDVPAGSYVIRGYTFHPPGNLWTRRLGLVRVVDDADDAGPGAALMSPARDAVSYATAPYEIRGCVSGPPGTTVRVQWARNNEPDLDDPAAWTTLETLEQTEGPFEVELEPPPEIVQQAVALRVVSEAPGHPTWTSFAPGLLLVFPGDGEPDDPQAEGPNVCPAGDGGNDEAGGSPGGAGSCSCMASRELGAPTGVMMLIIALGLGRRTIPR